MTKIKWAVGLVFAINTFLAQALPVTTNAPSGYVGDDVTVVLSDNAPGGLVGATVKVVFDPRVLSFAGGAPGTIFGNNPLDALDPGVSLIGADPSDPFFTLDTTDSTAYSFLVSLAYPFLDGANTPAGSLMDLFFKIIGAPPVRNTTKVDFSCDDFNGLCDYAFQAVSSTVTILERTGTPVPLPGTLPLLALGVASLWWSRRRMR